MKKYIDIKNENIEKIIKIVLMFSCPFLTLLLSNRFEKIHILIGMVLSFLIFSYYAIRKLTIKRINTTKLISSILIASYMIKCYFEYINTNKGFIFSAFHFFHMYIRYGLMVRLVGIAAVFSLIYFVYVFIDKLIPKVLKFLKNFTKLEKKYFIIVIIVSTILSVFINHYTSAFGVAKNQNGTFLYDIIYVSDSGRIVQDDAYFNPSNCLNDVRQPLFGIFALPFSVPAKILSEFCFFLPSGMAYATIMMIIQCLLVAVTFIMIGRLLNLEEKYKKYLYMFLHTCFYIVLWSLVLEQYAVAVFYLMLALYNYFQKREKINYAYVGAVGTLITSGIIFPVITKFKNIKQWIKDAFKCFTIFLSLLIIGGQAPQLFTVYDWFKHLIHNHAGLKISFASKVKQFLEFVKGMLIATGGETIKAGTRFNYHLIPVSSFWYIGIIILVLCVIGYILNRKEKFAKVCMLWIIFSFFVTVVVGWGAKEQCLALYGLYFSWAYLVLIFLLLKKIFKKYRWFKVVVVTLSIVVLAFTIKEFVSILAFAIKYYRVTI